MKKATNDQLLTAYSELKSVWKVGDRLGMCGQSVHERLQKLGAIIEDKWTPEEDAVLVELYSKYSERSFLNSIAGAISRSRAAVACRANELGITVQNRPLTKSVKNALSLGIKRSIAENGHPRGMLGKKHTPETLKLVSQASLNRWERMTSKQLQDRTDKQRKTKFKNGTMNSNRGHSNAYSRTKSGKRTDLNNQFFRSRVEANYARFMNLLGHKWEYEPTDFYFESVRRGCVSYTPDFYNSTIDKWIEIKGWFDKKSITKLNRFRKYYPLTFSKLLLVTQSKKSALIAEKLKIPYERYEDIKKKFSRLIPFWEMG